MAKNIKVKYIKEWKTTHDGIKVPEYGYKSIASAHYKRYYNTLCLLAGVSGGARNLLDYLCERMDGNNYVHSNHTMRSQFREDIAKWTNDEVTYSDGFVKKSIHQLIKKELLLKTDKRGTLIVNPEYFFKSDEAQRADNIKMILEFKTEKP